MIYTLVEDVLDPKNTYIWSLALSHIVGGNANWYSPSGDVNNMEHNDMHTYVLHQDPTSGNLCKRIPSNNLIDMNKITYCL